MLALVWPKLPSLQGWLNQHTILGYHAGLFASEEELNAAKTPMFINPMCFDSPTRHPTELD